MHFKKVGFTRLAKWCINGPSTKHVEPSFGVCLVVDGTTMYRETLLSGAHLAMLPRCFAARSQAVPNIHGSASEAQCSAGESRQMLVLFYCNNNL